VDHETYITAANVTDLKEMDFVFLCMDGGGAKRIAVEQLESFGISFIDVGMGLELVEDTLRGTLRVTTSTPKKNGHFPKHVSFADATDDDYDRNIQIADLNALNAALAVVRWKKLCGFYFDFEQEYHSTYTIGTHLLTSDEQLL
jgi:hypothetical protein